MTRQTTTDEFQMPTSSNDLNIYESGVASRIYLKKEGTIGINNASPNSAYALDLVRAVNGTSAGNLQISGASTYSIFSCVPTSSTKGVQLGMLDSSGGTGTIFGWKQRTGNTFTNDMSQGDFVIRNNTSTKAIRFAFGNPNPATTAYFNAAGLTIASGNDAINANTINWFWVTLPSLFQILTKTAMLSQTLLFVTKNIYKRLDNESLCYVLE
jgi:hypothetical protein